MLRVHGLRLDSDLTLAVKALVQTESVARALSTGSGLIKEGVPMLKDMVRRASPSRSSWRSPPSRSCSRPVSLGRLPSLSDATMSWLDQYQKGRFEVTVNTSQLSKEVGKLTRLGREIVIAVMLVGMLVGSAIASYGIAALNLETTVWTAVERLAVVGFVLSLILSFIIVLRLVWRWFRGAAADED